MSIFPSLSLSTSLPLVLAIFQAPIEDICENRFLSLERLIAFQVRELSSIASFPPTMPFLPCSHLCTSIHSVHSCTVDTEDLNRLRALLLLVVGSGGTQCTP